MVAENTKKTPQESASVQPATKRATPKKPTTTTPVKQSKPAPPPTKKPSKPQQESIHQEEGNDPDLELAKKMSLEAHQENGEGECDDADMERAIKLSLDPAFLPQGRTPVGGVTIRDPVPESTSKLHEVVGKGKAVVTEEQLAHSLIDLNRVGDLQLGIESYQTKINLERPNWDAADYYFKEDYTIVPKPRAVVYRDRNDQRKLMRLNELHKFSDGTLTRVMEKLDHMVKDFHLSKYNKGMESRKWSEDDKRRRQRLHHAIEKDYKIKRIYRSSGKLCWRKNRDIVTG
ncbi:hypothetical protein Tco_0672823 [Tanacetum coccineum]